MDVFLTAESDSFTNDSRPHGRMFVRDTINVTMYLSYELALDLFHWEVEILGVIYDIKELLIGFFALNPILSDLAILCKFGL